MGSRYVRELQEKPTLAATDITVVSTTTTNQSFYASISDIAELILTDTTRTVSVGAITSSVSVTSPIVISNALEIKNVALETKASVTIAGDITVESLNLNSALVSIPASGIITAAGLTMATGTLSCNTITASSITGATSIATPGSLQGKDITGETVFLSLAATPPSTEDIFKITVASDVKAKIDSDGAFTTKTIAAKVIELDKAETGEASTVIGVKNSGVNKFFVTSDGAIVGGNTGLNLYSASADLPITLKTGYGAGAKEVVKITKTASAPAEPQVHMQYGTGFSASMTGQQTIPSTGVIDLIFGSVTPSGRGEFDRSYGGYNLGTGYFTVPVGCGGMYLMNSTVNWGSDTTWSASLFVHLEIRVVTSTFNTRALYEVYSHPNGFLVTAPISTTVSAFTNMIEGDLVHCRVAHSDYTSGTRFIINTLSSIFTVVRLF